MITNDATDELKLIDFGIDKKAQTTISSQNFTAPEAITGDYTAKSDLWSIGIIIFYLFSGKVPFTTLKDSEKIDLAKKERFYFHT